MSIFIGNSQLALAIESIPTINMINKYDGYKKAVTRLVHEAIKGPAVVKGGGTIAADIHVHYIAVLEPIVAVNRHVRHGI